MRRLHRPLFLKAPPPVVVRDPHFASVSLLCPFNGSIVDIKGNTLTAHGSPTTSATGGPFTGTGYVEFTGAASQRITLPTSSAFDVGSGDWTLEMWLYLLASPQTYGVVFATTQGDVAAGIALKMNNASAVQIGTEFYNGSSASMGGTYPTFTLSAGVWTYIALQRYFDVVAGTTKWFAATGASVSSGVTISGSHLYNAAHTIAIGGQSTPSRTTNLRMANLRFTKGVARDLFAGVPTAPFPTQ